MMEDEPDFLQWFHVVTPAVDGEGKATAWGFASNEDDIILKTPKEYNWMEGETLQDVKFFFRQTKATVIKLPFKCSKY
jgi:hypothetical protein